jgi:uncharacterized membrane protein
MGFTCFPKLFEHAVVCLLISYRQLYGGVMREDKIDRLAGKCAVVTGTSQGIGRAAGSPS